MQYEYHPLANLFPLMEAPEFESFVENMRQKGQRDPIETFKGYIIDGRNRERACIAAGIKPQYKEWEGDEKGLLDYILSKNLHRRQLNESQKAMVGARLKPLFEQEAKKRQGIRTDISADLRGSKGRKTSEDIARIVNSSARLVESAIKVEAKGTPELRRQVESGVMRLEEAVKICDAPPEEQTKLLALPKVERKQQLKKRKLEEQSPSKIEKTVVPEVAGASETSLHTAESISDNSEQTPTECKKTITLPQTAEQIVQESIPAGGSTVAPKMSPFENFEHLSKVLIAIIKGAEAGGWVSLPRSVVSDLVKKLMPFVERTIEEAPSSEGLDAQPAVKSAHVEPSLVRESETSDASEDVREPVEAQKIVPGDFRKRQCSLKAKGAFVDVPDAPVAEAGVTQDTAEAGSGEPPSCFGVNPYQSHRTGECKKKGCKLFTDCCEKYDHPDGFRYASSWNQKGSHAA